MEKKLIELLVSNKITKEEFLKRYPKDLSRDDQYILSELQTAYNKKDADSMEYALRLLPLDNFTGSSKYVNILNNLLLADWHKRHEDIASLLNGIGSPDSIAALYKTATIQFDYLDYDDTYQLARKCIKALSAIGTKDAIEKIKVLSGNEIVEIAAYAQKELSRKGL